MSATKTFIDTNVLIYAFDVRSAGKQKVAEAALDELWSDRTGALSVQVLQEFYVNVTRKIGKPLTKEAAREIVGLYSSWCGETSSAEIESAFRIEIESRIGFWDALILASAVKAGATRILSEDMNAGQVISGVRIENPFV